MAMEGGGRCSNHRASPVADHDGQPLADKGESMGSGSPDPPRLGLSQRRVAELSGLTHGAICMIEQNKVSPSVASCKSCSASTSCRCRASSPKRRAARPAW
jgi:HTH-type transcriptional repressor of puuD